MKKRNASLLALSAAMAFAAPTMTFAATLLPGVGMFEGVAGEGTSNGDVGDSPTGNEYVYVTTAGSDYFGAGLGLGGETNGSELTTDAFTADAGDSLEYYFNYVTSDGSGFADYAYAYLNNEDTNTQTLIFNARTTTSGDTVPGFGLPAIDPAVQLNPASTPIVDNATNWSELAGDSGDCFDAGCGSTGWVQSIFAIADAGNYSFTFGVVNWDDQSFDSGLAISGLTVGNTVIIGPPVVPPTPPTTPPTTPPSGVVPLPAAGWMLLGALGGLGLMRRRAS
jgi:hypothetical protein